MVEFAPSTGGLALWIHHADLNQRGRYPLKRGSERGRFPLEGDAPPSMEGARPLSDPRFKAVASPIETDGNTIYYGEAFETLPLAAQVGHVAHEVLHVALRHPQRYLALRARIGDVDLQLFNRCADAIVNSTLEHLSWLELPGKSVRLDRLLDGAKIEHGGVAKALLEWDVERLYRAIDDRRPQEDRAAGRNDDPRRAGPGSGKREDGPRSKSVRALGGDEEGAPDLLADETAEGSSETETEAEATREWSERILRAHTGDGAFSMLRALLADLPGTRMPWEQVLRTRLARALSRRPALSWSRPSRSGSPTRAARAVTAGCPGSRASVARGPRRVSR